MIDALIVYTASLRRLVARIPFDTLFELVGICVIAYGVAMLSVPAGVIALGAGLCFVGYAMSRTADEPVLIGGEPE